MKSVILRTSSGSFPAGLRTPTNSPMLSVSIPVQDTVAGEKRSCCSSPSSISLHLKVNNNTRGSSIRRVSSESDMIRSDIEHLSEKKKLTKLGSRSFSFSIPETDESSFESFTSSGDWPQCTIPVEELGFPGSGSGNNWSSHGGGGGDFGNQMNIGEYYEQILKSDPSNALFLRNYAKYLHEVEKDWEKVEEYYGRAILANPGDGELLAQYGKLIWESYGDESRAQSYFDRAVQSSPDDCMVLGSYANFLWDTDDEDEVGVKGSSMVPTAMVEAF